MCYRRLITLIGKQNLETLGRGPDRDLLNFALAYARDAYDTDLVSILQTCFTLKEQLPIVTSSPVGLNYQGLLEDDQSFDAQGLVLAKKNRPNVDIPDIMRQIVERTQSFNLTPILIGDSQVFAPKASAEVGELTSPPAPPAVRASRPCATAWR